MKKVAAWFVVAVFLGAALTILVPVRAEERPVETLRLLNAASVDETASAAVGPGVTSRCRETGVYVVWGPGVASGVVEVESAHDSAYTGTWASVATAATFSGTAPNQQYVRVAGALLSLRTRISTVVAGGTVSTWFVCN